VLARPNGAPMACPRSEDRPVRPWWDADGHQIRRTLGAIVGLQLLPQSASFDAHDRIVTRIEPDTAVACGLLPDQNDWIVNCSDQTTVRSLLDLLMSNLATL
jgi:hypothetical protein